MGVDMVTRLTFPTHLELRSGLLREIRKGANVTQVTAATMVHRSHSAWAAWEGGRAMPTDTFELFCIKVGVDFMKAAIDGVITQSEKR